MFNISIIQRKFFFKEKERKRIKFKNPPDMKMMQIFFRKVS